ncbi:MAG: 6-hydroxymethylpterin diphosphokinase MptE-like protein [Microgenomates group bacterium]
MTWLKNKLIEANQKYLFVNWLFGLVDGVLLINGNRKCNSVKKYHNKYKGKRCFIIGNGPSLNKTDLSKLSGEYCFGSNRIYLIRYFKPTFLVSVNDLVLSQCAEEIAGQKCVKFISSRASKIFDRLKDSGETFFLNQFYQAKFSSNPELGVWPGGTVTFVCLQLAYYMGFDEVILVGVDHKFKTTGNNNEKILTIGDDPNHFSKDYFRGFKWNLPDLDTSEFAYNLAKKAYEDTGRLIVDATIGGNLRIFKKCNYKDLFL